MAQNRFLIAPIKEGLQTDLRPWLLPESAFQRLNNAYIYEGSVRKRFGSTYTGTGEVGELAFLRSKLRVNLGAADGAGALAGTVPGAIFSVGQLFSIGDDVFTVTNPAAGVQDLLNNLAITTATYDVSNGNYDFDGADALEIVYWYPDLPVMGLYNYEENDLNDRPSIAFDTQFAYKFAGNGWINIGPTAGSPFHGSDSQFFHCSNWEGLTKDLNRLFVTNFQASIPAAATDDPMWSYDAAGVLGWTEFKPEFIKDNNFVRTARFILPFKDRLILLNTIENDGSGPPGVNTGYPNRCRFSHNGSPLDPEAYLEPNQVGADGGGYIDAPTKEEIIGAEFIKDRLIVYFERSTWEIAYTANQLQPFIWQKINTELGSQSPHSGVPFDRAILNIGTTGIHACNGANVERIDNKIPEAIFQLRKDNDGPLRIAGVRDYFSELVYWTIPAIQAGPYAETFPNKVLVYNYSDSTWAVNDDTITAFGEFEQTTGETWADQDTTWQNSNFAWNSGYTQSQFREIIAGNQQGFVFRVDTEVNTNASVLQITNIDGAIGSTIATLTIMNHNLATGDYIKIRHCRGVASLNDHIYPVTATGVNTVTVDEFNYDVLIDTYEGYGVASLVSRVEIITKQYNPYIKTGNNFSIDSVDFAVSRTNDGEITVDCNPSSTNLSMLLDGIITDTQIGESILDTSPYDLVPLEAVQDILWHRVYLNTQGTSVQLVLSFSDAQMEDIGVVESTLEIQGFILNLSQMGRVE